MSTDATLEGRVPDGDRLPWLESAEEEHEEGPSPWRLIALAAMVLALVAVAVLAFNRFQRQNAAGGSGALINAQAGDYKIRPEEPGGMKVEGQGDTKFAASRGAASNTSVDVTKMPEAPMTGQQAGAARATDPGSAKVVAVLPPRAGPLAPKAPPSARSLGPQGATGGGSVVQLGSFPNEGQANAAWAQLSKRFAYIAGFGKTVEKAEVNGATTYRLRVNAGSAGNAAEICGKLKVAGEACFVPR